MSQNLGGLSMDTADSPRTVGKIPWAAKSVHGIAPLLAEFLQKFSLHAEQWRCPLHQGIDSN